jgi:hypothetical protein
MNRSHRPLSFLYRSLSLLFLILLCGNVDAKPLLAPFEIDYEINRSGLALIDMQRRLIQTDNGEYRFESNSRPTRKISWLLKDRISESSLWQFHKQQLRPLHYHYQHRGGKNNQHIELDFDWPQGIVNDSQRTPVWSKKIPPQTSDKLLYQLQLMLDLQAGKETLSYTIVDHGKIRRYDFKRVGNDIIELPIGRYETVKLHRNAGKRSTTIWCAPELNYLPVRIELTGKDGSTMQANATRIKGLPFIKKPEM